MYHNVPAFPSPVKLPGSYSRFSIKVKKSTNTLVSSGFHDLPLSRSPRTLREWAAKLR